MPINRLLLLTIIVVIIGIIIYGCSSSGSSQSESTTTTTAQATTSTTTTTTTTTLANPIVSSRSPTLEATGVTSTETIYITFSEAISYEAMTINNFFTDYATYGAFHTAGTPELSSASLTWESATNTLYISGITDWSNLIAGNNSPKVNVLPKTGVITDLDGNSMLTTATLWNYTLEPAPDPYQGAATIEMSVFTHWVTDEVGDATHNIDDNPMGGTFYFDENDITSVSAAVVGDRIVVYVQAVGTYENTLEQTTIGTGEVINYRDVSIGLDLDNNDETGYAGWGMDIQITIYMAVDVFPDCQWGVYEFNEDDTHAIDRFWGQVHGGGTGYNYVIYSAPVSAVDYLGVDVEKGLQYKLMGWSESETVGGLLDVCLDTIEQDDTAYVPTVMGGE